MSPAFQNDTAVECHAVSGTLGSAAGMFSGLMRMAQYDDNNP